jgi:hypothetical protein
MKVMIKVGYNYIGVDPGPHFGLLLMALQNAKIYTSTYNKGVHKFVQEGTKEQPTAIEITFAQDEEFNATTPLVDQLVENLKVAEARWLDAYNAKNKLEAELKVLKDKIAAFAPLDAPKANPEKEDVPY